MRNRYSVVEDGHYIIYFSDDSYFQIDAGDFPVVSQYTWSKGKRGYPVTTLSRKSEVGQRHITVHRLILGPQPRCDVDHISGDKLDNRRANLRVCSHQENMFNQKLRATNKSGYSGVAWHEAAQKYEAYVHMGGKKHYLGLFVTADDAARARDEAAMKYFGEYARLNDTRGGDQNETRDTRSGEELYAADIAV